MLCHGELGGSTIDVFEKINVELGGFSKVGVTNKLELQIWVKIAFTSTVHF